jgi:hypothetical protein
MKLLGEKKIRKYIIKKTPPFWNKECRRNEKEGRIKLTT